MVVIMPRNSERKVIINALKDAWRSLVLLDYIAEIQLDDFENDILDAVLDLCSSRYLEPRTRVPKSPQRFGWFLSHMDEKAFKQRFRLNRDSFFRLVNLVKGHAVFRRKPRKQKQVPVHIQVLVALCQLGTEGNGSAVRRVADDMSVAGAYPIADYQVDSWVDSPRVHDIWQRGRLTCIVAASSRRSSPSEMTSFTGPTSSSVCKLAVRSKNSMVSHTALDSSMGR